jgi:Carboxypeptidase regulatory-like domain
MTTLRVHKTLAALLAALWPSLAVAGSLCAAAGDDLRKPALCIDVAGENAVVAASDTARRYVWRDRTTLWLGTIKPGQTTVTQQSGTPITLQVTGATSRPWPVDVTVEVVHAQWGRWIVPLTSTDVAHAVTMHVPAGATTVTLRAPGYEPLITTATNIRESLRPALRVTARVVDSANAPVPFASLRKNCEGKPLCETDVQGKLACDLLSPVPASVCIEGPNAGRSRAAIDPRKLDTDLGTIVLRRGTTLVAEVPPYLEFPAGTTVTLLRKQQALETRPAQAPIAFEDVEPGDYTLLLQGPQPGQHATIAVTVAAAREQKVTLDVTPYKLTGLVRAGDKPVGAAEVQLEEKGWSVQLHTNEEGRFETQLWAPAMFAVFVSTPSLSEPWGTMKHAAIDESDWTLDIPDHKIIGRVTDAQTAAPIPRATVRIQSDDGAVHANRNVLTDDSGNYELPAVSAGTHTIRVSAPGYLVSDGATFRMQPDEREQRADFGLTRGRAVRVTVVNEQGAPRAGALVVDLPRVMHSDESGSVTVVVPERGNETVYVLPAEGSLAVAHIADAADSVSLPVPNPAGAIRLIAVRDEGQPLSGAWARLRFNGDLLPRDIVGQIARLHGTSPTTDAQGQLLLPLLPAGMYELCLETRVGSCDTPSAAWSRVPVTSGEVVVTERYASR